MDLENADVQSGTSEKNKNKQENMDWFSLIYQNINILLFK